MDSSQLWSVWDWERRQGGLILVRHLQAQTTILYSHSQRALWGTPLRGLFLFTSILLSWLNAAKNPLPSEAITLGVMISTNKFGEGDISIWPTQPLSSESHESLAKRNLRTVSQMLLTEWLLANCFLSVYLFMGFDQIEHSLGFQQTKLLVDLAMWIDSSLTSYVRLHRYHKWLGSVRTPTPNLQDGIKAAERRLPGFCNRRLSSYKFQLCGDIRGERDRNNLREMLNDGALSYSYTQT